MATYVSHSKGSQQPGQRGARPSQPGQRGRRGSETARQRALDTRRRCATSGQYFADLDMYSTVRGIAAGMPERTAGRACPYQRCRTPVRRVFAAISTEDDLRYVCMYGEVVQSDEPRIDVGADCVDRHRPGTAVQRVRRRSLHDAALHPPPSSGLQLRNQCGARKRTRPGRPCEER